MLKVITWKWKPFAGYRSTFEGHHVNVLAAMVRRHYRHPHEFILFTDDDSDVDQSHIIVKSLPARFGDVPSPHGVRGPSCYRRLNMFSPEFGALIGGSRFVSLDLDTVITGDLAPLWDRDDDFIIWGDTAIRTAYNGSMILMNVGARRQVFDKFDPVHSPRLTKKLGMVGSDQAWISHTLGQHEKRWTMRDGVYSFRLHINVRRHRTLPDDARVVFFHGSWDPWLPEIQRACPWILQHWRMDA